MISCARLADGGAEGSNKILAVDIDEAAPSVGTTVALLGHQFTRISGALQKNKRNIVECCRLVTAFRTLQLPVLAGY